MWTTPKKSADAPETRPALVNTAEAFCKHIENAAATERTAFIRGCLVLISRLVAEAVELLEAGSQLDSQSVPDERHREIADLLKAQFGEDDYYKMMFDPYEIVAEPVVGCLSDDLADIWRDIKHGSSFRDHWGQTATQVLRPLASLLLRDAS